MRPVQNTDVGLTVGNKPVLKAGRLVEFIPMCREITSDLNILNMYKA